MSEHLEIPLYNRHREVIAVALADKTDREHTAGRWHLGSGGYARRNENRRAILMHRLILGLGPGSTLQGDHINRNKLDNRRNNLRIVTHAENMQNRMAHSGSTSRFRGVHWDAHHGKWRGCVRLNNTQFKLGAFATELQAALAVEAWRRENMPFAAPDEELARLDLAA